MIWRTDGGRAGLWNTTGRRVLGGGADPAPSTDPSTLTVLRHVVDRCASWRTPHVAGTQGDTIVTEHTVNSPAKGLRIRRGSAGPQSITGRAALWINGALHPLTWGGLDAVDIPGLSYRDSDPLPDSVQVEAGDSIYSTWEVASGGVLPIGSHKWITPMAAKVPGKMYRLPAMNETFLSASPELILGKTVTSAKSFVCLGDSIVESGWMRRAAHSAGTAWTDLSVWLEQTPQAKLHGRLDPTDPAFFTLGLMEHGTNNRGQSPHDFAGAQRAAEELLRAWTWLTAGPVPRLGQTTMVPYTTGNYSTRDGQAEISKAWRDPMNAWLRDGAPIVGGQPAMSGGSGAVRAGQAGHPLIGICDIAAAIEVRNSAGELVWETRTGMSTSDGIHPTLEGADLMQPTVEAWLAQHQ